ncbi:MAG: hypothetical protein U9O82_00340 [Thermodesulfobacteriota bacterium]|nr:hypothetical protein [Thermodesulfobacteriota bacterium]
MYLLSYGQLVRRFGRPQLEKRGLCHFAVPAAGKYGGMEMGFASDIELFFVYEGSGETEGAEKINNSSFFEKLVRLFMRNLKSRQDGIFHIDLRLRPYGEKGSLASSLNAFSNYYSQKGPAQQFERLALVKLRSIAGARSFVQRILKARDAFVYSGLPVDYENIRHLRARQAKKLAGDSKLHVKYSPGGLVDLEYFIQALQIEHGQKLKNIHETNTILALSKLRDAGLVHDEPAINIRDAYQCLRRIIDALRVVRGNAKDLFIPDVESRTFRYLARRMGYNESDKLKLELEKSMDFGLSLWKSA